MLLSVWFVSSMAFVYPVFRGRMDVKAAVALGKALRRASERARERERERERERQRQRQRQRQRARDRDRERASRLLDVLRPVNHYY